MVLDVIGWIAGVTGILSILWFIWYAGRPHREREAEDDARAFFDEHGRWPDEPAGATPPERAPAAPAHVEMAPPGELPAHVRARRPS